MRVPRRAELPSGAKGARVLEKAATGEEVSQLNNQATNGCKGS